MMKTVRVPKLNNSGVGNRSSVPSTSMDKHENEEDEEEADENHGVDGDDECEDPIATATRVMDTCLASDEFQWLTAPSPHTISSAINPLEINTNINDMRNPINSATIPPQPQHKSRKSGTHRQRRIKDRDYPACQMSPTPFYDNHVCRHRLSPMRSTWCCPSPPPHGPPVPMCLHGGGSITEMEIVPYGQECCPEDPNCSACYCIPPGGHQHVRHCSPCHHYTTPHYSECPPASPQKSYRNGQRSHSVNPRMREFSPSSSPVHRPYYSADMSQLVIPPQNMWDEQWKQPTHAGDATVFQKMQRLESEKKNVLLQTSVLNDQVEAQAEKIRELENALEEKKEQLRHLDQNLHREVMARNVIEGDKLELLTELSSMRLRLTASERDRKDSDDRCRKMEGDLRSAYDYLEKNEVDGKLSPFKNKPFRNGTLHSPEKGTEVEKLNTVLENIIASNQEKDKKIEDLRLSLIRYKKLHEVLAVHQRKPSDPVTKDGQYFDIENIRELIPPPSPGSESAKSQTNSKFLGKPPSGLRSVLPPRSEFPQKESVLSLGSASSTNTDSKFMQNLQALQKSSSLENVWQSSLKTVSPKTPYGTIPRQNGPEVLQHLQEQLQHYEGTTMEATQKSPTPSEISRKQRFKEVNRNSRNKSSGVSFGKGFFKLRSGKRSTSAPELAPFEPVTIPIVEREVSSACVTPQPTMQPFFIKPEKDKNRGLLKFFTKWKRSGSQNIEKIEGDFRRGGIRATAGPRLGWSRDISLDLDIPFCNWNNDVLVEWFHKIGLNMYIGECRKWRCNGEQLLNADSNIIEKELGIKNILHKKKLMLALQGFKSSELPEAINNMDYQWITRWLDDVGLPQYKDSFLEARVDGRMLHYLTIDDLLMLKVTNQLHHVSIKRGIQILREKNFDPHCLVRRYTADEKYTSESVSLWTNHRVMEWLRTVDLSEYAPNLRGSGVHGALIVYEPKFNTDLFATLLNIPPNKTLLRRHLATHFKSIVGNEFSQAKRDVETDNTFLPLTPNVKIKGIRKPQFTLKKKKYKGDAENDEFVCPMDFPVGSNPSSPTSEKLIVRRNSDPTSCEARLLAPREDTTTDKINAVSKEITSFTDGLQEEKLLTEAPSTNV